jgi:signal transduction histidine kinase
MHYHIGPMADGTLARTRAVGVRHAEGQPHHLKSDSGQQGAPVGVVRRTARAIWAYLPRGTTLDAETFRRRHLLLCWILGLHLPALFAFGIWQGLGVQHAALELVTPAACLVFARLSRRRRVAAFFVSAGLVFCSSVLVHMSHGSIEAHFHFFVLVGLIALYQDWVPFLWNAVFTVLSHGVVGTLDPDRMYNHLAGQNRPWLWATIHGVAVLGTCVGVLVFWRNTEQEQSRTRELATELATAELATAQAEAARRQSMSQLLVNLARRNQSLLDRQLALIADLEQREVEPDALANLFQLDHVATRIRRNAESLLVLSGDEPPRRWGQPVPLAEVIRAASAEVEDYQRVEVLVNEHLHVAGRAVADLAHLLAELIENATMFSPPTSEVRVRSHLAPTTLPSYVVSIEDTGIGMTDADRQAANLILSASDDSGLPGSRLGFHVINRLARRYGLQVQLAETPGGGVTAMVTLPHELVSVRAGLPESVGAGLGPDGDIPPPPPPPPPFGTDPSADAPAWTVSGNEVLAASAVVASPGYDGWSAPGLRETARQVGPHEGVAPPALPAPPVPPAPPAPAEPPSGFPAPPGELSAPVAPHPPEPHAWTLPIPAGRGPEPTAPAELPAPATGPPDPAAEVPGPSTELRGPSTEVPGPSTELRGPSTEVPGPPPGDQPVPSDGPPTPPGEQAAPSAGPSAGTTIRVPGLARRVPGEALAAVRDRAGDPDDPGSNAAPAEAKASTETNGGDGEGRANASSADSSVEDRTRARARVSAMLSRFQASQRAGRAYTESQSDAPAEPPASEDQP